MAKRGQALSKARAVKRPAKPAVDLKQENAALKQELAQERERQAATSEALTATSNALTATSDVLKIISRSTFDLAPVLETVTATAARLCEAEMGFISRRDGNAYRFVTAVGTTPETTATAIHFHNTYLGTRQVAVGRETITGRVLMEGRALQITDLASDPEYKLAEAHTIAKIRTLLGVPLLREGEPIGVLNLARQRVEPFTERQIELVRTFADQAVIAIENTRLLTDQREALEQQTATAEVLQVINASPGDLNPVFEAMLEKALGLCGAAFGILRTYDGETFHLSAHRGVPPAYAEFLTTHKAATSTSLGTLVRGAPVFHIADAAATDDYQSGDPWRRAVVDLGGARTLLAVPLRKDGSLRGAFVIYRQEVRPFSDKQIALLQNFATQAVIAMENARLLGELRDRQAELARSVDELTATGDVLKIISRSSVDLETVLDTLVETVARLCRADHALMYRRRDNKLDLVASCGLLEEAKAFVDTHPLALDRGTVSGRVGLARRAVQIPDVMEDAEFTYREHQKLTGARTLLGVPLLRGDELIGIFSINRARVEPFTDKEIELATSFADQAVIAIENARLFEELRERQAELARSVDELTATGDVLKIISRSSVDLETVLDTLVETVARLCRADRASMVRRRDDAYHTVAAYGFSEQEREFIRTHPLTSDRRTVSGRVTLERRAVHIPDVLQDPEYAVPAQKIIGYRTALGIPLLREDALIGIFLVTRTHVEPFTSKEIELVQTFADQAVIAIENARLFDELRDRQAELRVTFDNMGDGVVMFDAEARLTAWNRNFQEMLELPDAFLAGRPSLAEYFHYTAERGEYSSELEAELGRTLEDTSREMRYERTRPDGRVIEVRRNPVPDGGFVVIFSDITERKRAEAAISAARDAAESALRELQTAQASLVHAQKMAALGQLTAGIAHEIKNPLNFVNNFAGLSVELLDELKQASAKAVGALDADERAEIVETIGMLTSNLEKIAEHGRRADGIVKSMLQHSRGGSGDWQATDLNALVEEALNLAYHGARAQDQSFNITMERDLDRNLASIDVVPQDMMRVFLNLIGNGFYAANKRQREKDGAFRPALKVTTRDLGEAIEIRVRDNGIGIPSEYRDKLFQPFFTTKPTGEGTGLGLSISFEIVSQQHGGTITVESELGHFTEFTVRLPRRQHPAAGRAP